MVLAMVKGCLKSPLVQHSLKPCKLLVYIISELLTVRYACPIMNTRTSVLNLG